ncbi:MAG: MFS transporter [Victivallales bacterium]|nr:MFS transporter [Victivallales bacterium]
MDKRKDFVKILSQMVCARFLGLFNASAFVTVALLLSIHDGQKYFEHTSIIARVCLAFILPFMIFPGFAGYVADRYPRRNILVFSKLAEMFIMLGGVFTLTGISYGGGNIYWFLFLLGMKNCFFRAGFFAYIPEVFETRKLGVVNGVLTSGVYFAVACGVTSGFYLQKLIQLYPEVSINFCGWLFFAIAVLSAVITSQLPSTGSPDREQKVKPVKMLRGFFDAFSYPAKAVGFGFAIIGEILYYTYMSAIVFTLLILIRRIAYDFPEFDFPGGVLIFASPFAGVAAGSLLWAIFCRGRLNLSFIPFAAAGMVLFPLLSGLVANKPEEYSLYGLIPLIATFMLSGLSAALFILPLRQFEQENAPEKQRGRFYANCNTLYFLSIIITFVTIFTFSISLNMRIASIFFLIAAMALVLALCIIFSHPDILLRCVILILSRTLYRMELNGIERLPDKGPALLVSNHVSFGDMLVITACSPRKIYFMMHEDFYNLPVLNWFARWVQFIKVPATEKPGELRKLFTRVRELLREGNMVCVFPEGRITANGIMQGFRSGIKPLLPEDVDVPVFPVRLGMMWGSLLNLHENKIKISLPHEFPIPVSLTIGTPVSPELSAYQARQVISEIAAETEMPPRMNEKTLHYQFACRARRRPLQKSFKDFEGKELSNFSILVRAILLSRKIREVVPEEREYVGVMLPGCLAHSVTLLAVMMADKTPAILNFTASKLTLEASIAKADLNCILTSRQFINKAGLEHDERMVFLEDMAKTISGWEKVKATLAVMLLPARELMNIYSPDSYDDVHKTAAILFSSGSTAEPKGVMLSHHNFNSDFFSFWRVVGWKKSDKIVGNLPLFHSFGLMVCFWLPMISGAEVIYTPNPLDAGTVLRLLEKCRATLMVATPTFLQAYLRKGRPEQFKSLRLVVTGGEKLRRDIADKFNEVTGLTLVEGYGCTELSPIVSINLSSSVYTLGTEAGPSGSIGVPLPGICVKIVDPDTLEPLPEDTEGLMMVKAPSVMKGYLKDSEGTARVVKNGWYNTGDIAKMAWNGYLTITGRLSRFSKISGEMVPHEMIEVAISEIICKEEKCIAVAGKSDKRKGEKLVVFYSDKDLNPKEIVKHLQNKGITNLWIPKADDFISVDEIPLLGSGKLDLRKINELAETL